MRTADSARWAVRPDSATTASDCTTDAVARTPIVDDSVVAALVADLGEEFVRETANLYLAELDDRVAAVRRAAVARDVPGLVGAAHTLKSASALLGLSRLAESCRCLEHAGRAGTLPADEALGLVAEAQSARAALLAQATPSQTMEA